MFNAEIRTKLDPSYISICSLSILYDNRFILMTTSLGTNVVVVTRVHCIYCKEIYHLQSLLPDVDALIYVDTDTVFLSPVEDLWSLFLEFSSTHLMAISTARESPNAFDRSRNIPIPGNTGKTRVFLLKKSNRKVQGVPQSQTAALPRPQEEEETDKSKQAQTEQTYEKH